MFPPRRCADNPTVWGRCKDPFGQPWGLCEVQTGPTPSNDEMSVDMKIGAKYDWKYTWIEEDVPKMYCFGEVRSSGFSCHDFLTL